LNRRTFNLPEYAEPGEIPRQSAPADSSASISPSEKPAPRSNSAACAPTSAGGSLSSGGVSSRLFVAIFGGGEKVRDFVSVSGTHHGTQVACLGTWTGEAAEEMCPPYASEAESHNGMQWMLNGDPDTDDVDETPYGVEDGGGVTYSALWTEDDLIDVPPHTCCLNQTSRGDCTNPINIMFSGIGHIEMSSHTDVIDKVFELVRVHNINKP